MKKCSKCKKEKNLEDFKERKGGELCKQCKECNEKSNLSARKKKRKRSIEENYDNLVDSIEENSVEKETENKKTRNKNSRSEKSKRDGLSNYNISGNIVCLISGQTPVEGAHLIPHAQDDSASNIIPLRPDLHTSFDLGYWAFDPNTTEDITDEEYNKYDYGTNKIKKYKIVCGRKCPYTDSIIMNNYEGEMIPILDISIPFIKKSWEIFNEKNSPTP